MRLRMPGYPGNTRADEPYGYLELEPRGVNTWLTDLWMEPKNGVLVMRLMTAQMSDAVLGNAFRISTSYHPNKRRTCALTVGDGVTLTWPWAMRPPSRGSCRGFGVAVDHADLLSQLIAAPNVDRRTFWSRCSLRHSRPRARRPGHRHGLGTATPLPDLRP
jgi:hypothetical protein